MATRTVIRGSRNSIGRDARKAFSIDGLQEVIDRLEKTVDAIGGQKAAPEIKQVVYEAGEMIRDQAKANAPYDPNRKEGTHLRDAIFVSKGDDTKADVLVGVRYFPGGAPHAHLVEYGHAVETEFGSETVAAQPYFRPALTQVGERAANHIKNGLVQIIQRNAK